MNEKAVVFDWLAVPGFVVGDAPDDDPYHRLSKVLHRIVATCDSVEDALELMDGVDKSGRWQAVLFLSDIHGNAVVVEGEKIVRKRHDKDYFVATNFRQSAIDENAITCVRHSYVTSILESDGNFSVDQFRDALDVTHAESPAATLYSNVYEPKLLRIHLYHFHDYRTPKVLDLKAELEKGKRVVDLSSLFEANVAAQAFASAQWDKGDLTEVALNRTANDYVGTFGSGAYHITIRESDGELWALPSLGLKSRLIPIETPTSNQ